MGKPKILDSFFKKKYESYSKVNTDTPLATEIEALVTDERPSKCQRIQPEKMDATIFQRDPGLRPQIWEFLINLQDKMRRAYINTGQCQPILSFQERVIIVADFKLLGSTHTQLSWSTRSQRMPYFVFNAMFLLRNQQAIQDQMHLL
jgi:hypothetical protein